MIRRNGEHSEENNFYDLNKELENLQILGSELALLDLVGKMYSKIHSCWLGGGTNHRDTKDTEIDHYYIS